LKIAITGSQGFIGLYVLDQLLKCSNIDIVIISRNLLNFNSLIGKVSIVQCDIYTPPENLFEQLGYPNLLIHLAWDNLSDYYSLQHFQRDLPKHYKFLENLITSGLSSVLVTGTCLEYGLYSGELIETQVCHPNNPYAYAKLALYNQLKFLQQVFPFSLTWARLFYMYGKGQLNKSLYSQFQNAIREGQSSFKMSQGEQLRDYLPVAEVANYLVQLALQNQSSDIVNVCSGNPISVRRLVESWIESSGTSITLDLGYYSYPTYEPMAFWGNCSKLREILSQ